MATKLNVGEVVYVPRSLVGLDWNSQSAFCRVRVNANNRDGPSVTVGTFEEPIPMEKTIHPKFAHRTLRTLIIAIGDYLTEESLIVPLHESLRLFFKLLLPEDELFTHLVHTREELTRHWMIEGTAASHVILIAHGRQDAVLFGHDDWVDSDAFSELLPPLGERKYFVSLACLTGDEQFAKSLSRGKTFHSIVAPDGEIHASSASQFCQTFFSHSYVYGLGAIDAWRKGHESTPGNAKFAFWTRGRRV